jgi:DNA-binding transcriptional LysR family regulator
MSFEDLRAFLLVADEGSFLSAADRLGVSRTTLRRQVDALEAQAGVPLLDRGAKGAVLTEAGKRLRSRGREMEQEFAALLRSAKETSTRPEGEVRILLQIGLPPPTMGAIFGIFRSSWPGIRIRARFTEAPLEANLADVDIVVWFGLSEPGSAWETHTLVPIRQRLFASKGYLEEHGVPHNLDEVRARDLLAWLPLGEREAKLITKAGTLHQLQPILASTNVDLIHACARMGQGIAWAPDADLPLSPGEEPMIPILEDVVGYDTEVRLAVPRALAEVPKVRVFIEAMDSIRMLMAQSP